jgi:upstream activation factor subunit UAF30
MGKKKETAVVAVVAAATTAVAPVKETKTTKASKVTKETKPLETKLENVVVSAETLPVVTDTNKLGEQFTEFMAKFQSFMTTASLLKAEFRVLEKNTMRELKAAQKISAKKKRKNCNRSPSGFVKPTLISLELATFLGKPEGSEMARTEVTREINHYIREHNLQDKSNGRKINPDKNLATLLKIQNGEELTYFNLQRYMSPHFAKAGQTLIEPVVGASVPVAVSV